MTGKMLKALGISTPTNLAASGSFARLVASAQRRKILHGTGSNGFESDEFLNIETKEKYAQISIC